MNAVLRSCLGALPLKENQPGAQGKPAAASLDATSTTSRGSDRIQEEDEEDVEMGCKHDENNVSMDNIDKESVGDSNDLGGSKDDDDMLEGVSNMMTLLQFVIKHFRYIVPVQVYVV